MTIANSAVHEAFLKVYAAADTVAIEFNEEWNNGTGYFDNLTKVDLDLPVGARFRSNTSGEEGRKIVGVVTGIGNVVFFERFLGGERGVIVSNVPQALSFLIPSGSCEVDIFQRAAMWQYNNIGHTVEGIVLAARNAAYVPVSKHVKKLLDEE